MNKINSYLMSGWQQICAAYRYMASSPRMCMMLVLMASVTAVFADGATVDTGTTGVTALEGVATDIKKYIEPARKVCYALAGIVAVLGAISIYIKMNNEEQDVKKSIMMIIGACVFLIAAAQALPLFFGIEDGVITGF